MWKLLILEKKGGNVEKMTKKVKKNVETWKKRGNVGAAGACCCNLQSYFYTY